MNLIFNNLFVKQSQSYNSLPAIAVLKQLSSIPSSYYSYTINNDIININYINYLSNNISTHTVSFPLLNNNNINLSIASYYINSNILIQNNISLNQSNLIPENIKKNISLFNIIGNFIPSNYRQFRLLPSISTYNNENISSIRDMCFLSWLDLSIIDLP